MAMKVTAVEKLLKFDKNQGGNTGTITPGGSDEN